MAQMRASRKDSTHQDLIDGTLLSKYDDSSEMSVLPNGVSSEKFSEARNWYKVHEVRTTAAATTTDAYQGRSILPPPPLVVHQPLVILRATT